MDLKGGYEGWLGSTSFLFARGVKFYTKIDVFMLNFKTDMERLFLSKGFNWSTDAYFGVDEWAN